MTTQIGHRQNEQKPVSTLDYIRSSIQWVADSIFGRDAQEAILTTAKVGLLVVGAGLIIAAIIKTKSSAPRALEGRTDVLDLLRLKTQGQDLATAIIAPRVMPMPMPPMIPPVLPPQVYIPLPHHPPCDYHLRHSKHKHNTGMV